MLCFYKAKTVSLALGYSLLKAKNNKKDRSPVRFQDMRIGLF